MIPENNGAPEAIAMPRHNGSATRKTTKPEAKSDLRLAKMFILFVISIRFNTTIYTARCDAVKITSRMY
jgi:hypothetical protein